MTGSHLDLTTRRLASYVVNAEFAILPAQAVHEARRRIVDSIACAAGAYLEPFCARTREFASMYSGTPQARIWGSGQRTSIEMAAFANGTMLRYLDHNDTHFGRSAGHPSDMIGALVATAEAYERSGEALVAAIVSAYEIYCSLCNAVALKSRAIDQATAAAVGTSAGVGRLLGLNEDAMGHALSLALAPNLHLYNVRRGTLSQWKGCAGPNGARNGAFAALLAARGFTGPSGVIEGKGGLMELMGQFDWQAGRGQLPLITGTHLKLHPVCYHGQSAIDATLALRPGVSPGEVEQIEVETYDASFQMMGAEPHCWAPATRETADHSLPFTVAVALEDGRLNSDSYAPERLVNAGTRALMNKIRVTNSDELTRGFPQQCATRVTVHMRDGRTLVHLQEYPKGNAGNVLSEAELEAKFTMLYQPWGDQGAARCALDALWSVERAQDIAALLDVACSAASA